MTAAVHYRVELIAPHAHLYRVTLTIAQPRAQQVVALPVWIPGSYLVREFAKNLQQLQATQGGKAVALQQLDKHRWQIASKKLQPLVLTYEVAAYDTSVRTAWLDAQRGFFNGTSLCLRVLGQEAQPHDIEIVRNPQLKGWSLATGLTPEKVGRTGFGTYRAADYDELVDCPVEMGPFWSAKFTACGVAHRFVVAGAAPSFDGARLLADTRKICEEEIRFWHGKDKPPYSSYLFMLNVTDDGYGGLEHRNSTALICSRRDLPRLGETTTPDGYTTLLGLISHEYFHTWNVKRMRPAEFKRYNYDQENYTELLWFFEGFTSYYDDLLLRRAQLIDDASYLRLLTKTINQVQQTPGRHVQSVAQSSFDAWVKYYRQDENTANATVSYYTKGSLVALCLDLALRRHGRATLDTVMRGLWQRTHAGPLTEAALLTELRAQTGKDWTPEITLWVHGTQELPLQELLAAQGVTLHRDPAQLAQRLGLRVTETQGLTIKAVLRGGAAEAAGMMAGDEWLTVAETADSPLWRMQRLDDLLLYAGPARTVTVWVSRDRRVLPLTLNIPPADATGDTVRLGLADVAQAHRWLDRTM